MLRVYIIELYMLKGEEGKSIQEKKGNLFCFFFICTAIDVSKFAIIKNLFENITLFWFSRIKTKSLAIIRKIVSC